jgi:hypothetical protein
VVDSFRRLPWNRSLRALVTNGAAALMRAAPADGPVERVVVVV